VNLKSINRKVEYHKILIVDKIEGLMNGPTFLKSAKINIKQSFMIFVIAIYSTLTRG